jgi:hypothetical protein
MTNSKHPNTIIRHAIVARLVGQTATGAAVRASRKNPWKASEVPAGGILVYTEQNETESDSTRTAPVRYERAIDVVILIAAQIREDDTTPADDAVDALTRQVEILMIDIDALGLDTNADAQAIGLIPSTCIPVSISSDLNEDGSLPVSFNILKYRITVYDQMLDANIEPLDNLVTADAKYNLGGAQAPAEITEDIVTLPT